MTNVAIQSNKGYLVLTKSQVVEYLDNYLR